MAMNRDKFAPRYEIMVNNSGQFLPKIVKSFIKSVTVEDDAELFDKITLEISALSPTQDNSIIEFIDSKLFQPGNLIEVFMGYGNSIQSVGAGYIVRNEPSFGQNGVSLKVTAYDPFFKLSQTKATEGRPYAKTPDAVIIGNTLSRQGISLRTGLSRNDPNPPSRFQTKGQNDYQFIKRIADILGFELYLTYDTVKKLFVADFEPPTDKQAERYAFEYYTGGKNPDSTLLSFAPTMNTMDQATSFEIVAWSRSTRKKIQTKIDAPPSNTQSDIKFIGPGVTEKVPKIDDARTLRFKAFGENLEVVSKKPFQNEKAAKIFIEKFLKDRLNQFISGRALLVGLEYLRSRQKHEFNGLGEMYSGTYYIEKVIHKQGVGQMYTCDVIARKAITNLTSFAEEKEGSPIVSILGA